MEIPGILEDHLPDEVHPRLGKWWNLARISLLSGIYWINEFPWLVPRRQVQNHLLIMPVLGDVEVDLGKGKERIHRGRAALLAPDQSHAFRLIEGHKYLEQMTLHFHLRDQFLQPMHLQRFPTVFNLPHSEYRIGKWMEIIHMLNSSLEVAQILGEAFVKEIVHDIFIEYPEAYLESQVQDHRIKRVLSHIQEGNALSNSVLDLAKLAELGVVQFRKIFRREVGVSPNAFLAQARLAKACEHLKRDEFSLNEVAHHSGFENPTYFFLCFKKNFGVTPSQYRQQHR